MTARLLISPAGAGKSMWVAREAVDASQDVAASPVICVARPLQVFAMVERLGAIGGALGVRVMTFDSLAAECLTASRVVLPDPGREVTFRILQSTIRALGPTLEHFGVLADRPGLAEEVRRLIVELESARIDPPEFAAALDAVGRPARLSDIAAIYSAYKAALDGLGWSDRPGVVTRAIRTLEGMGSTPTSAGGLTGDRDIGHNGDIVHARADGQPAGRAGDPAHAACRWSHLLVDGFDDLSAAQLELLALLAGRVGRLDITLTGDPTIGPESKAVRRVHRRFASMRLRVERRLGIEAEPLPASAPTARANDRRPTSAALRYLEGALYRDGVVAKGGSMVQAGEAIVNHRPGGDRGALEARDAMVDDAAMDEGASIELIEAPDRAGEVREALRWIKARIIRDQVEVDQVALLARDVEVYRTTVLGIAAEMRIPIRLAVGLPLESNPAVAALLEVLRLARRDADGAARLTRRQVVDAWRSPYFDWSSALQGYEVGEGVAPGAQASAHQLQDAQVEADNDLDTVVESGSGSGADASAAIADSLDAVARWGRVIGGEAQWREAFERLLQIDASENGVDDEERGAAPPPEVPRGAEAVALLARLEAFVRRLEPIGEGTMRRHVYWVESLIGRDPLTPGAYGRHVDQAAADSSLQLVARCRRPKRGIDTMPEVDPTSGVDTTSGGDTMSDVDSTQSGDTTPRFADAIDVARRDISALEALKDVLRALVAADEALADESGPRSITFDEFLQDLAAAVESAVHPHDPNSQSGAVLLADVVSARGLPFRAVALLGVAEGEFPASISENPFLRDAERTVLRKVHGLEIANSTESSEIEYFYETITRPSERLLLTRPRLADNGAMWKASPFWEEVIDLTGVTPRSLNSADLPAIEDAAGLTERFVALAMRGPEVAFDYEAGRSGDPDQDAARSNVSELDSGRSGNPVLHPARLTDSDSASNPDPTARARWRDVVAGAEVLHDRARDMDLSARPTPYDGDLGSHGAHLADRFGPEASWSPSALETMVGCGFRFFVERGLGLRPREEPAEGLNAGQLGTIYHGLLEAVYERVPPEDRTDADALVAALDELADPNLDLAPAALGFRPTAWWRRTRDGIKEKTRLTLRAICDPEIVDGYTPLAHELGFGLGGAPALVVEDGSDRIRIRGVIDRVERSADGRLRIVDYKTAGPSTFTKAKLISGEKLQIALYALAARDALKLGDPTEGFYWHVQHAESSSLKLSGVEGGIDAALGIAAEHAWSAVRSVRDGRFQPTPPKGGCPSYCAAAAFCWRYTPSRW